MIKLVFLTPNREMMYFLIEDRIIYYSDRIFRDKLRLIPKDEAFIQKIRESRNKWSMKLIEMFTLSEKQMEEYNSAKTEEDLANIIIKDCIAKGITLQRRE